MLENQWIPSSKNQLTKKKEDNQDDPQCCKRYFGVNKKRLLQMELVVKEKSKQIAALALTLGPGEAQRGYQNTIAFNGRETKSATSKGKSK
jgi:hypothetical protein